MPKVSVVIPCFNHGRYLDEAVDSVLAQTYRDFEIIVVNDGSTDDYTVQLLDGYVRPVTRVISTPNRGLAEARNSGIREAAGRYILPLDADDRIGDRYLEKGVEALDRDPGTGIVYCFGEMFGCRTGLIAAPAYSPAKMLLSNLIFASALFRKEDWEAVGGYNPNMRYGCEDWDFWLSLLERRPGVYRIPEVLFYYRIREASMNAAMDRDRRIEMHLQLMKNHPELFISGARPLLTLYHRITGSRTYSLLKRLGILRLLGGKLLRRSVSP